MSLTVAIPFGVASSVVYGTSIVVQHRVAQQQADDGGTASAAGLIRLARNRTWLLAIAGDFVGFMLQIVALSTGPVVVVQPLVVLMLPVSLIVSAALGWHRPRTGDYLGVLGVISGLAVFLVLIGNPGAERLPPPRTFGLVVLVVLAVGVLLCVLVAGRTQIVRGAVYGAVAGSYFGMLAVLVDAASSRASDAGIHGLLATPKGLVPLSGIALLGAGGIMLTQMSFQIGALAATLPANLAADPLTAVLLGVLLLHEHIPLGPWHLLAYTLCLLSVVAGAIRLADPEAGPIDPDTPPQAPDAEAVRPT
ncbi:MAG TPA: DMT family transporter [Gaiellales bacterium]|nr:DMT family transporter [Gaiellales bacterium]